MEINEVKQNKNNIKQNLENHWTERNPVAKTQKRKEKREGGGGVKRKKGKINKTILQSTTGSRNRENKTNGENREEEEEEKRRGRGKTWQEKGEKSAWLECEM